MYGRRGDERANSAPKIAIAIPARFPGGGKSGSSGGFSRIRRRCKVAANNARGAANPRALPTRPVIPVVEVEVVVVE